MRPSQTLTRLFSSLPSKSLALAASLSLAACGGGTNTPETPLGQQETAIISSPELDGPVSNLGLGTESDQRPSVGQFTSDPVHALFSFDLRQIPTGATIVSASLRLTSLSLTGDPAPRLGGKLVIDHLNYGAFFPSNLDEITDIPQSGVALWDDIKILGPRMIDVTEQVRADRMAGRIRSQYQVRGLLRSTDNRVDLISFGGAENQNGDEPVLTIVFDAP